MLTITPQRLLVNSPLNAWYKEIKVNGIKKKKIITPVNGELYLLKNLMNFCKEGFSL
jgi:hypothetical protein